jgi:hypothetical protein
MNYAVITKAINSLDGKKLVKLAKDNMPRILSCCAVGCLGGAVVSTAVGMHKADEKIAQAEPEKIESLQDKVALVWKDFVPAALFTAAAVTFIVASERKSNERYIAVMGAYQLAQKANDELSEFKASATDILGEEKADEMSREARVKVAERNVQPGDELPSTKSTGDKIRFKEYWTGKEFYATTEEVLHAFNYLNYILHSSGTASINDFLSDFGFEKLPVAEPWGWDENTVDHMIEPVFDSYMVDDNGDDPRTGTLIMFSCEPSEEFDRSTRLYNM